MNVKNIGLSFTKLTWCTN